MARQRALSGLGESAHLFTAPDKLMRCLAPPCNAQADPRHEPGPIATDTAGRIR
jgi:hypothetical protein